MVKTHHHRMNVAFNLTHLPEIGTSNACIIHHVQQFKKNVNFRSETNVNQFVA